MNTVSMSGNWVRILVDALNPRTYSVAMLGAGPKLRRMRRVVAGRASGIKASRNHCGSPAAVTRLRLGYAEERFKNSFRLLL